METGELASGLQWWTASHPDWEPTRSWPPEVRCFCVETRDATLIVDPLVADDDADLVWRLLDSPADRHEAVHVLLTQAAHSRSAHLVADRYSATIWGPKQAQAKVASAPFTAVAPGDPVPGGFALEFDQEAGGSGAPLYFPQHAAVAVGDVFISRDDGLHVWWGHGARDVTWYERRLLPSLRGWLALPIRHVLVAHGPLVPPGEVAAALEREPDRGE